MASHFLRQSYLSLPSQPGVYHFLDKKGEVLYVGKARDLKKRVASYFTHTSGLGTKTRQLVDQIYSIEITIVESELESLLLEANDIKKFGPKYNIRLTDGKSYPLIRLTVKDDVPAVLMARRPDDKNSVYFGPYPSSSSMKLVMRTIRRIFPFQSTINHGNRPCLYHHLGLCPCVSAFGTDENKKDYNTVYKYCRRYSF